MPVVGEVGELVITEPMPSMPVRLWGDEDGSRYRARLLRHVSRRLAARRLDRDHRTGTAIITGRSDATINRGGIRMGTSEIYRAVVIDEVVDALVVDLPRAAIRGYMPLFVVLRNGVDLDDARRRIRARIREDCSPRHVPDEIRRIDEVPALGQGPRGARQADPVGEPIDTALSRDSLANPASLRPFELLAESPEWRNA